jgi:hypothetical protein
VAMKPKRSGWLYKVLLKISKEIGLLKTKIIGDIPKNINKHRIVEKIRTSLGIFFVIEYSSTENLI